MIKTKINGKYELMLPEHRAAREFWNMDLGGWEAARIDRMLEVIKPEDIVFDLGVEEGDITALLAKYSKCDLVMVEPNPLVWPCIREIWDANWLREPADFFDGFFSSETTIEFIAGRKGLQWIGGEMIPAHGFAALSDQRPDIPQIKMDDYCRIQSIYPTVITMDVEGSEFEVVKGAENVLREYRPHIFMSLHPEFMHTQYKHNKEWAKRIGEEKQYCNQLLRFVDECGYTHHIIEWDYHECHIEFIPK